MRIASSESTKSRDSSESAGDDVRSRILDTAQSLFYARGVRAVGIDLIIAEARVAKASLYRHFATKDELIAAYLAREDLEFWQTWDAVAAGHATDAHAELDAQLEWIGRRVGRPGYRGCPQINVAAEFSDLDHPARLVATNHKVELRRRLEALAARLGASDPSLLGGQLAVLINGAFVSSSILSPAESSALIRSAGTRLVASAVSRSRRAARPRAAGGRPPRE